MLNKYYYLIFALLFFFISGCTNKSNNVSLSKKTLFYDKYTFSYESRNIIYSVYFPFNQAYLSKKDEKKLLSFLNNHKKSFDKQPLSYPIYLSIESSCDACGNERFNYKLGKKRILYVKKIIKNIFKKRRVVFLSELNLGKNFSIKCKEKKARFAILVIDTNNEF